MTKEPIAITGWGLVSCFGSDPERFYQCLLEGKSGVELIDKFAELTFSTQIGAPVRELDSETWIEPKLNRRLDPNIRYAMVAGKRALKSAAVGWGIDRALNTARCGILMGSGIGGMHTQEEGVQTLYQKGYRRVSPFYCPYILTNMAGALLGVDLGFTGPNYSISTACATASNCLLSAMRHIERGDADLMLAGGTEGCLNPMGMAGFMACRAVSKRNSDPKGASRPWDQGRDGFVMAEGAGALVLESLAHAKARRAPILALLSGAGLNCDGYHMTNPRPEGTSLAACMRAALQDASCSPDDIQYINAHATSTSAGDLAELHAIGQVFGTRSDLKINATKSMIGHSLGASGALEAIATIQALRSQWLHPTINLENPEPLLDLQAIPQRAQPHQMQNALSNSSGFGGHNCSLVFSRWQG